MTPEMPPIVNVATMPTAYSIAVLKRILPPHIVASQLNIFTPVGIAMIIVEIVKNASAMGPMPVANMWCAHTPQPMMPISTPE